MDRRIRYHPLFDCDVREAARWYDQRSAGLGDAFVDAVRRCATDVIANPERFAKSPLGCRYIRLPRFPYVLLFDLVDDELLMLCVLHTARSMEKWRERQQDI
jgi:hypothetical protein